MLNHIPNNGTLHTANGLVRAPGMEQRLQNQNARIGQGIATGSLSQDEAQQVGASRQAYATSLTTAKEDGVVSGAERRSLHQELNAMSAQIAALKHN